MLQELIDTANGLFWGSLLIYLLLGIGIYFTFRSRFVQVRHFGHMFKVMKNSLRPEHGGISAFEAFSTSLAARVGTGNIAGVAVALTLGGPGAIFWMWMVALIGMCTAMGRSHSGADLQTSHGRSQRLSRRAGLLYGEGTWSTLDGNSVFHFSDHRFRAGV